MKRFRFAAFCAALLAFTACDVVKQAEGLYNMTQCEYEYDSVTDLSLAGVNLSGELTPLQIARLLGVLGGGASELPMGFDLNLGISNPNSSAAQIGAMDYILEKTGYGLLPAVSVRGFASMRRTAASSRYGWNSI